MKILGHRGIISSNINLPYQNTIEAIEYALNSGADGVEIDVWKSKDNLCFVIHDDEIKKHSIFDSGKITQLKSGDIKNLKVGKKYPYKIPTLREVIYLFRDKYLNKILNIEIKQKNIFKEVLKEVEHSQINLKNIIFSSFNHQDLSSIREINKDVKLGILYGDIHEREDNFAQYIMKLAKNLEPSYLNPNYKCKNKKLLSLQKEKFFWTVNKLDQINNLSQYPHVNIITDKPGEIIKKDYD